MNAKPNLYVADIGIISCLGETTQQTLAAINAGISQYSESPVVGKDRICLTMALVPDSALPPLEQSLISLGLSARHRRMLRLASKPLLESLSHLPEGLSVPLFLALPEDLPGMSPFSSANFIRYLAAQSGVGSINVAASRTLSTGRVGGLQALDLAFRYLNATGEGHALIGGVDTYWDLNSLSFLDSQDRLKTGRSKDGFVAGEGAAFLLLSSAPPESGNVAAVYYPGLGEEQGHRYSDNPYTGDGLADAMRSAIGYGSQGKVRKIYSSLNGEHFGAREYGVAVIRNSHAFTEDMVLEHPADCIGDIGAAFAPLLMALAAGETSGNHLVYCSSDGAYRGAVCIESRVNK